MSEIADDVLDSFTGGDTVHDGALDAVGQFPVDVTGQHKVVVGHEVESVGVDNGEHAGGELVDAIRTEVPVKRHLRRGELLDAAVDALAEGRLRRLSEKQRLVPVKPGHGFPDVTLQFLEAFESSQLVVRE